VTAKRTMLHVKTVTNYNIKKQKLPHCRNSFKIKKNNRSYKECF